MFLYFLAHFLYICKLSGNSEKRSNFHSFETRKDKFMNREKIKDTVFKAQVHLALKLIKLDWSGMEW